MKVNSTKVNFSYLDRQFSDIEEFLVDIQALVKSGDFTLGAPVREFEEGFARLGQMPYAIGVGSGTDALAISLKLSGIGPGDEVITTPMTFIATVGAIVMAGARPIFVDSEDGFLIDPSRIEAAITKRAKAIVPVHYTGNVADMPSITSIAKRHNLVIVEDACQSIQATLDGQPVGTWGETACFSLHPLKNLNVWGDGGVIVTKSKELAERIRRYRNHGLTNRNEVEEFGWNSRLDGLQAVIGNRLMGQVQFITDQRIANAKRYDQGLKDLTPFVRVPTRRAGVKHVYHLYMIRAQKRDELITFLNENGIEAKIHYPIPVHLQKAAKVLGYQKGDFPVCESDCEQIVTLPAHQHMSEQEIDYVIERVRNFYGK